MLFTTGTRIIENYISFLTFLLIFPLIMFFVLTIHELGHFFAAKIFNLHIEYFKLGYGKNIWSRTIGNTIFSIHPYPFGAHVELNAQQFNTLSLYKKLIIILGGPIINFILAFILFLIFLFFIGQPSSKPIITGVEINYVAEQVGFQIDDEIISINDKKITRYEQVLEQTKKIPIEPLFFEIQRNNIIKSIEVTPQEISYVSDQGIQKTHARIGVLARHTPYDFDVLEEVNGNKIIDRSFENVKNILYQNFDKEVVLGLNSTDKTVRYYNTIVNSQINKKYFIKDNKEKFILGNQGENFYLKLSFSSALNEAVQQTSQLIRSIITIPLQVFPINGENLSPKTVVIHDGLNLSGKLYKLIFITALLSLIIGIINLIPVGYLDGGRVLIILIEKIISQPMTTKQIGFTTFLVLIFIYGSIILFNYSNFKIYMAHLFNF